MKFGPVTKLDKRNKTTLIKFDDDVMSENCNLIDIFPIYCQFGSIWKPNSGQIVCKTYILTKSGFLILQKLKTELKIFNAAVTILH